MNILNILLVGLLFLLGVGTSIIIVGYMIIILLQKFYGKLVHKKSLYD